MGLLNAELRQGTRRNTPDPGFWVKWSDLKFYADANVVYIEGHEDLPFIFEGEIKILESYPQGVRVTDGRGKNYLIQGCPEIIESLAIYAITDPYVQSLIQEKNKINGF